MPASALTAIRRSRLEGWLVRTLVVIAVLNLNGFFFMLLGVKQVFSLLLLLCAFCYFMVRRRMIVDAAWALFVLLCVGYIMFGML